MKQLRGSQGFTLAEVMISVTASIIIIAALVVGCMGLQRALHNSEQFATAQSDQRRLIDYIGRDLRRAVSISTVDEGSTSALIAGQAIPVSAESSLVMTLPGYYQSNTPSTEGFDQALPVVTTGAGVDYGTKTGVAPGVPVCFRKSWVANERSVCFVREEAGATTVVVRKAERLYADVEMAADGKSCVVRVWFDSPYSKAKRIVSTYDQVLLRNRRIDATE